MVDYRFAYMIGTLIIGVIWIIIFLLRRDLRKEQIFMSFLIALAGFSEPIFFGEYWKPQSLIRIMGTSMDIESFLLCFFYGGIASTCYEFIFNKVLKKYSRESRKIRTLEIIVAILTAVALSDILWSAFKINIIYATTLGLIAAGCILIVFREDLFLPALVNGIIVSTIFTIVLIISGNLLFKGIFDAWWRLDLLSGVRIIGVPLEETMWHFSLGFAAGPLYEVWKGYSDLKK